MDKDHLLGLYRTKLNHIKLTYASIVMWSYPDIPRVFKELHKEILKEDKRGISELFPDIEHFIDDDVSLKIASEELYSSAHRSAIKELLPLTKYYCHNTEQLSLLKSQPWFQFWNILRNCWSHDMKFNFGSYWIPGCSVRKSCSRESNSLLPRCFALCTNSKKPR